MSSPFAVEVAGDVERRVVAVAALAVVAVAAVLGAQRIDRAIHELPRTAMVLAGVAKRRGERGGNGADDGRVVRPRLAGFARTERRDRRGAAADGTAAAGRRRDGDRTRRRQEARPARPRPDAVGIADVRAGAPRIDHVVIEIEVDQVRADVGRFADGPRVDNRRRRAELDVVGDDRSPAVLGRSS